MSRIGKKPVKIEKGVEVKIDSGMIFVKGPKGELKKPLVDFIDTKIENDEIIFTPKDEENKTKALWGLQRALVQNMVDGVNLGFSKKLELVGVGYKANVQGKDLVLDIGFSHSVTIPAPEGITFTAEKTNITVSGIDKELVGQTAASIRKIRKPEPYKGKGIRYEGEVVRKKLGKKAAG
ncbi:MAG TPA: 50S ribosomal protein L6 [Candidatus Pacearchaeota archaeon]|nr:50S ribosomal protein L6 [Candidatus Pacearchaeota archaeon]